MVKLAAVDYIALINKVIGYRPTEGQAEAIRRIANFLEKSGTGDTYLLKGYAGTGKTTIISALVRALPETGIKTLLLAPTGRAAKVVSGYSGKQAHTIHRRIYRTRLLEGGGMAYELAGNSYKNTLLIVDEASMIAEGNGRFGERNLLKDLLDYVKSGENCRLLLVGDTAQLPPVHEDESPALDIKKLSGFYGLRAGHFELTEVVRQEETSGILTNATIIRDAIRNNSNAIRLKTGLSGFERISSAELGDKMNEAFGTDTTAAIVITRSNKAAINYNRQIRFGGLWFTEELDGGDLLMCAKNNYFWLDASSSLGFIANGDILKLKSIRSFEERYGFRFAEVTAMFADYPEHPAFELKIIMDSLYSEGPALTRDQSNNLYTSLSGQLPEQLSKTARYAALAQNEWYNAVQVKFAYAVTCHKAQGGQWDAVFIDAGSLMAEGIDKNYLRWLYTAITRATKKVYLINFDDGLFE
ncbi:MAG TPA: AAA family ATPase [Bacteroidia bacterium]|nr:AAA family ATPase [Bacteroidia bacterium]